MKPLIILTGPTAVGKTSLSIKLAKEIGGEIISADSMQVYKGLDIGSAKVTPAEMDGVRHYLIDEYDFTQDFNVNEFARAAKEALAGIYAKGKIPIIAGGTGFYIQAVLKDIDFTETDKDEAFRNELEELAEKEGPSALHKMLEEIDPEAASQIHENNIRRVIRALEFAKYTGEKISDHNASEAAKPSPYNFAYFVLTRDRKDLYDRIDVRVDEMMSMGLLNEVTSLKNMGATAEMTSMQGLGYKELLEYLDGQCTLEEAVNKIKQSTRHYAKRQLTWFRREKDVIYLDAGKFSQDEILQKIHETLIMKGIIK